MSNRKIFSLIGLCLSILLIICIFIPYYDFKEAGEYMGGRYLSLWEYYDKMDMLENIIIVLVELVIAVIAFILQLTGATKDSKLAYLGVGYLFTAYLMDFIVAIDHEGLSNLYIGFWLGFIIATITIIITFVGNLLSNERKVKPVIYPTVPIVGYDPQTGQPIYAQLVGYNPQTGEPIYQ